MIRSGLTNIILEKAQE